jgi:uncharacterized protein YaiL (DUF2058 family)
LTSFSIFPVNAKKAHQVGSASTPHAVRTTGKAQIVVSVVASKIQIKDGVSIVLTVALQQVSYKEEI